jgi:hypothetical protein
VTSVVPLSRSRLLPTFSNGEQRVFDVSPYLDKGIFTGLANARYFGQVRVVAGHVEWPEAQDFSRDTLYLRSVPALDPSESLHVVNEPPSGAAAD